jgi:PIN domain nuclease of toxin-antitoxin system
LTCVLDAYAVIAALVGERAGVEVRPLLSGALVCAPNLAEVIDVCTRVHGNEPEAVHERIEWLVAGGLEVAALDASLALTAGALRARRYARRTCEVSLGDCCAATLAATRGLKLATSDQHLTDVARAERIALIALPDSKGRRPRTA